MWVCSIRIWLTKSCFISLGGCSCLLSWIYLWMWSHFKFCRYNMDTLWLVYVFTVLFSLLGVPGYRHHQPAQSVTRLFPAQPQCWVHISSCFLLAGVHCRKASRSRDKAVELAMFSRSGDGYVWGGSAQSGHVDSRVKLQPYSAEWEGPEPRAGHHWGLRSLQTSFLCGLVLLEHRHSDNAVQPNMYTGIYSRQLAVLSGAYRGRGDLTHPFLWRGLHRVQEEGLHWLALHLRDQG